MLHASCLTSVPAWTWTATNSTRADGGSGGPAPQSYRACARSDMKSGGVRRLCSRPPKDELNEISHKWHPAGHPDKVNLVMGRGTISVHVGNGTRTPDGGSNDHREARASLYSSWEDPEAETLGSPRRSSCTATNLP
nr:hypothetical protein CFP56_11163 [Quercus suber]